MHLNLVILSNFALGKLLLNQNIKMLTAKCGLLGVAGYDVIKLDETL